VRRLFAFLALTVVVPGCNPIVIGILATVMKAPETEHFELINETDYFHRSADHHDFKSTETYTWHNCGEQALVDGDVEPSCPNDVTIKIWDAEMTIVFEQTYHAPHCGKGKKDWDPVETAKGVPGDWTIEFTFDISGVKDLNFYITRLGGDPVVVTTSGGAAEEEDPDGDRDDDGKEDEQQGSWLLWHSECTWLRTVAETYELKEGCRLADISASWESISAGEMRVIVKDGLGVVVFEKAFTPADGSPFSGASSEGSTGTWTVTLVATDFSSEHFEVKVERAKCGCGDGEEK